MPTDTTAINMNKNESAPLSAVAFLLLGNCRTPTIYIYIYIYTLSQFEIPSPYSNPRAIHAPKNTLCSGLRPDKFINLASQGNKPDKCKYLPGLIFHQFMARRSRGKSSICNQQFRPQTWLIHVRGRLLPLISHECYQQAWKHMPFNYS